MSRTGRTVYVVTVSGRLVQRIAFGTRAAAEHLQERAARPATLEEVEARSLPAPMLVAAHRKAAAQAFHWRDNGNRGDGLKELWEEEEGAMGRVLIRLVERSDR